MTIIPALISVVEIAVKESLATLALALYEPKASAPFSERSLNI
jgi:hypothetical protein